METTALQACDNIPSTFQAPKPYLFYAGQTKPNILERVLLFSQSFMENLATKIFYNFNGASKLERHAALTGKDMSEYDSGGLSLNKMALPSPLQMGIWWHSSQTVFSLLFLSGYSATKARNTFKKSKTKPPSPCAPAFSKTNKHSVALSNSLSA